MSPISAATTLCLCLLLVAGSEGHCQYYQHEGLHAANCSTLSGLSSSLQVLRLTGHIELLDDRLSSLSDLKELHVSGVGLRKIYPEAFRGLRRLEVLDLSHNRLSEIPGVPNLQRLLLRGNPLGKVPSLKFPRLTFLDLGYTKIKAISDSSLKDLTELKHLKLDGNALIAIKPKHFPHSLMSLDVSNNNIRHFSRHEFQGLDNLDHVEIAGNPLYCNCDTLKIRYDYIMNKRVLCVHPRELQGVDLFSVKKREVCLNTVQDNRVRRHVVEPFPETKSSHAGSVKVVHGDLVRKHVEEPHQKAKSGQSYNNMVRGKAVRKLVKEPHHKTELEYLHNDNMAPQKTLRRHVEEPQKNMESEHSHKNMARGKHVGTHIEEHYQKLESRHLHNMVRGEHVGRHVEELHHKKKPEHGLNVKITRGKPTKRFEKGPHHKTESEYLHKNNMNLGKSERRRVKELHHKTESEHLHNNNMIPKKRFRRQAETETEEELEHAQSQIDAAETSSKSPEAHKEEQTGDKEEKANDEGNASVNDDSDNSASEPAASETVGDETADESKEEETSKDEADNVDNIASGSDAAQEENANESKEEEPVKHEAANVDNAGPVDETDQEEKDDESEDEGMDGGNNPSHHSADDMDQEEPADETKNEDPAKDETANIENSDPADEIEKEAKNDESEDNGMDVDNHSKHNSVSETVLEEKADESKHDEPTKDEAANGDNSGPAGETLQEEKGEESKEVDPGKEELADVDNIASASATLQEGKADESEDEVTNVDNNDSHSSADDTLEEGTVEKSEDEEANMDNNAPLPSTGETLNDEKGDESKDEVTNEDGNASQPSAGERLQEEKVDESKGGATNVDNSAQHPAESDVAEGDGENKEQAQTVDGTEDASDQNQGSPSSEDDQNAAAALNELNDYSANREGDDDVDDSLEKEEAVKELHDISTNDKQEDPEPEGNASNQDEDESLNLVDDVLTNDDIKEDSSKIVDEKGDQLDLNSEEQKLEDEAGMNSSSGKSETMEEEEQKGEDNSSNTEEEKHVNVQDEVAMNLTVTESGSLVEEKDGSLGASPNVYEDVGNASVLDEDEDPTSNLLEPAEDETDVWLPDSHPHNDTDSAEPSSRMVVSSDDDDDYEEEAVGTDTEVEELLNVAANETHSAPVPEEGADKNETIDEDVKDLINWSQDSEENREALSTEAPISEPDQEENASVLEDHRNETVGVMGSLEEEGLTLVNETDVTIPPPPERVPDVVDGTVTETPPEEALEGSGEDEHFIPFLPDEGSGSEEAVTEDSSESSGVGPIFFGPHSIDTNLHQEGKKEETITTTTAPSTTVDPQDNSLELSAEVEGNSEEVPIIPPSDGDEDLDEVTTEKQREPVEEVFIPRVIAPELEVAQPESSTAHQEVHETSTSAPVKVESSTPGLANVVSLEPETSTDEVESVSEGDRNNTHGDMKQGSEGEQKKSGSNSAGSYIVLGVIMCIIVLLLGYAVIRSHQKKKRSNKKKVTDVENPGRELQDVSKPLIDSKPPASKELAPDETEEPLMSKEKEANGDLGHHDEEPEVVVEKQPEVETPAPPAQNNGVANGNLAPPVVANGNGVAPVSPSSGRVKVVAKELPDSVAKRPILIMNRGPEPTV